MPLVDTSQPTFLTTVSCDELSGLLRMCDVQRVAIPGICGAKPLIVFLVYYQRGLYHLCPMYRYVSARIQGGDVWGLSLIPKLASENLLMTAIFNKKIDDLKSG